jgi:hypothetical protein
MALYWYYMHPRAIIYLFIGVVKSFFCSCYNIFAHYLQFDCEVTRCVYAGIRSLKELMGFFFCRE